MLSQRYLSESNHCSIFNSYNTGNLLELYWKPLRLIIAACDFCLGEPPNLYCNMDCFIRHNTMGNAYALYAKPEITPDPRKEPAFDALMGFPNGRKERVMVATEDEMKSAKLALEDRDFCAHKLLKYRACRSDKFPFVYRCHHEKHEYMTCEYEDYVLRMKEYERERRLMERAKRIERRHQLAA